jgi:hypothetical protein
MQYSAIHHGSHPRENDTKVDCTVFGSNNQLSNDIHIPKYLKYYLDRSSENVLVSIDIEIIVLLFVYMTVRLCCCELRVQILHIQNESLPVQPLTAENALKRSMIL